MAADRTNRALVMRENGEWLRYVFWGCAIGMALLAASTINSPARDLGKILGSAMGALLFAFSGFVLQSRRIVVDPLRREVLITSRGFRQMTQRRIGFDQIRKILVLTTFDNVESLRGAEVMRERWAIALALEEDSVNITRNLYTTREVALRDAGKLRRLLGADISDNAVDSIEHLARNGRSVDALTLATRALGMTIEQAKEFVDRAAGQTTSDGAGRASP